MDKLNYEWRISKCSISVGSNDGIYGFAHETREYEYIDFIINNYSLGDVLQINGQLVGWFLKDIYKTNVESSVNDFVPFSKSSEVILYHKPFGTNPYDHPQIICEIYIDDEKVTWKKFGIPNPAWTDPIDWLRDFHFDKIQYTETIQRLLEELKIYK